MLRNQTHRYVLLPALLVLAALLAGCGTAGQDGTSGGSLGEVSSLTVTDQIETSGTLSAAQLSRLNWGTTGVVEKVSVQVGDQVSAGDILAALRADSVPADVLSAQADLAAAQRDLDTLRNSGTAAAQAQLALVNAQEALTDAQNGRDRLNYKRASSAQIENAEANLALAKDRMEETYQEYQRFNNNPPEDPLRAQAYTAYYAAVQAVGSAQANLNWLVGGPSDSDLSLADANLAVAQAAYDDAQREWERLKAGPDAVDLAAAKATVAAAQAAVNSMYIIAPFDGEVLAVETSAGDPVESGDAAIVVVNPNTITVEALVDETEISQVSVGDLVELTLDAMPETKLTGKVALIDPIGSNEGGLVKYTVFVAVDPTEQPVLYGATTDVTLLTSAPRTMLAVPIGAVQYDGEGEYVLRVASEGTLERVNVTSDAVSDGLVTLSGELKEGDRVLVGTASSTAGDTFEGPGGGGLMLRGP
jgi:HlyD family secretion protein